MLLAGCGGPGSAFGVELRAQDQHRSGGETAGASPFGMSIAQSFRPARDGLSRVEIQLKSFPAPLPSAGAFHLREGDGPAGPDVRTVPFERVDFSRNPYLAFSFPPVERSAGRAYTFVLESGSTRLADSISAHLSPIDAYSAGTAYLDGDARPGDLTFRTYYAYTPAMLAGDVLDTLAGYWWLALAGITFLWLPGLALGAALRRLMPAQVLLAAPGLTLLSWPVVVLAFSTVGLRAGALLAWAILLVSAILLAWRAAMRMRAGSSSDADAAALPAAEQPPHRDDADSSDDRDPRLAPSAVPLGTLPVRVRRGTAVRGPAVLPVTAQSTGATRDGGGMPGRGYWLALGAVLLLALLARLVPARELWAGMGLDAYHHTLVLQMFLRAGGVPADYQPYAPLASFTYHFGFHAFAAALGWLAPGSLPVERLMLLAGQLGGVLPVLSLALFGWRVLGDRRLGLIAGALAGLVAIFPAFYLNWSRYTQGFGLALLPLAWVVLFEALAPFLARGGGRSWRGAWPGLLLAAVCCAGLFLTHYRVFGMFATYAALYLGGRLLVLAFSPAPPAGGGAAAEHASQPGRPHPQPLSHGERGAAPGDHAASEPVADARDSSPSPDGRGGRGVRSVAPLPTSTAGDALAARHSSPYRREGLVRFAAAAGGVALVALLLLAPWLLNLRENFRTRFAGSSDASNAGYYDLRAMLGDVPLQFWSTTPLITLAGLGLAWCLWRRKWAAAGLALWLGLHLLWGNPTAFPFRLPGAGYVDAVTVATSAFVPICLLAAYPLLGVYRLLVDLPALLRRDARLPLWRPVVAGLLGVLGLVLGAGAGMRLVPILDVKPYVTGADVAGMRWLRENAPAGALVLGSGFGQTWGPQAVQGSDAALWTPVLAGLRSTLPPIPAYNERPVDPDYLERVTALVLASAEIVSSPPAQAARSWDFLRRNGVTHIFIGSRGGVLDPAPLLHAGEQAEPVFHQDGVWIFRLR